ncbi:MAG: hypothetical protein J7K02_02325 [Deltaproteobacteria bacterium]|nr:hypothetical protein [Deltaproteobacteria bacterium]
MKARKKTAIIASYFAGESYGLPGPPSNYPSCIRIGELDPRNRDKRRGAV